MCVNLDSMRVMSPMRFMSPLVGSIALQILKEFLQHLNLKQTLTIFEAEVGYEVIQRFPLS